MGKANQSVENNSRPISKAAAAGEQGAGGKTQHRVSMRWQLEPFMVYGNRRGRGFATKTFLPGSAHCFGVRPYLASPFEGRSAKVGAAAESYASESTATLPAPATRGDLLREKIGGWPPDALCS